MCNLVVLYGDSCGYCKKAKMLIRRALEKEPAFASVSIEFIEVSSDAGKTYAHKYIPAFYINDKQVFEGNPEMSDIQRILQECMEKD